MSEGSAPASTASTAAETTAVNGGSDSGDTLVITGIGWRVAQRGERIDAVPFLRSRKSRKYLGVQDALAVVVTGGALERARLLEQARGAGLGERVGLYLAVGYIPFTERDIDPVLASSLDEAGAFSMARFAAEGYQRAHPLLAFRCLPNMPAYHIAVNFDVQGPYYVAYPSAGQLYLALQEAQDALVEGIIDKAIVCGVAHQTNFLVQHHHGRLDPPTPPEQLRDAAAAIVLERRRDAAARGATPVARLSSLTTGYRPFDALTTTPAHEESAIVDGSPIAASSPLELGPAAPLIALAKALEHGGDEVCHQMASRDGIAGKSHFLR